MSYRVLAADGRARSRLALWVKARRDRCYSAFSSRRSFSSPPRACSLAAAGHLPVTSAFAVGRWSSPTQGLHFPAAILSWIEELDENNVPEWCRESYQAALFAPPLADKSPKAAHEIMEAHAATVLGR